MDAIQNQHHLLSTFKDGYETHRIFDGPYVRRRASFYILLSLLILGIILLIFIAVGSFIVYITYTQRAKTRIPIERKDECSTFECKFGAKCILDKQRGHPYCECNDNCFNEKSYVCGNDNKTYQSDCHLRLTACQTQTYIYKKYEGECVQIDPKDDCRKHGCKYFAKCEYLARKGYTCICPDQCVSYGNDLIETSICGNDGNDYINECHLKKSSCLANKNITIHLKGKCNPCSSKICSSNELCVLDSNRNPSCGCPVKSCLTNHSVCGSDGITYKDECSFKRISCYKPHLTIVNNSKCNKDHPCNNYYCLPPSFCNVEGNKPHCICPTCQSIYQPVCGTDGVTYTSRCQLQRSACIHSRSISLLHTGICEKSSQLIKSCANTCLFGGICILDGICQCPQCDNQTSSVCGSNGISYNNECSLRRDSCLQQKPIYVSHEGPCMSCEQLKCKFYAICETNYYGIYECICPQVCLRVDAPVCGSNGVTYDNECELRVRSCKSQTHIEVAHLGACDACQRITCKNGAICENGRCVCPYACPDTNEPICANDGNTYHNECELKKKACLHDMDLRSLFYGNCDHDEEPSGSGDLKDVALDIHQIRCDLCDYGGTCKNGVCECNFECEALLEYIKVSEPVCGSDGRIYDNICIMNEESCKRQVEISSVKDEHCFKARRDKSIHTMDTCENLICEHGAECIRIANQSKCVCNFNCDDDNSYDDYDDDNDDNYHYNHEKYNKRKRHSQIICASDGNTYKSECFMRLNACESQTSLHIISRGRCT